ncbi:MAG TPA: DUF4350 domain-containing protein, partial [Dongiaceae bacterium]|nr:DUF4350 domain-containing protein [Dongiaceae bacterium]
FLEKHHIESHRSRDLHSILDRLKPDDTLVLFNDTPIFSTTGQERLEDWMQSGGHLIIAANYEWDEEEESSGDPFLDKYGVRMTWADEDTEDDLDEPEEEDEDRYEDEDSYEDEEALDESEQAEDAAGKHITDGMTKPAAAPADDSHDTDETTPAASADIDAKNNAAENGDSTTEKADKKDDAKNCSIFRYSDPFLVDWNGSNTPLSIDFGFGYTLEDASGKATGNADHWPNGLLQYSVGKGMMTVMVATDIWENEAIGDYDHAFLLWYLVSGSPNVWLVVSNDSDSLITLLWRNAKYWLLGLAAMLLIWGWRRWVRFGPMIPDITSNRRQLQEHLDAEARFNWQHQQMEPLLKAVRDDIWLRLSQQHGIHHHASNQQALDLQATDQHNNALQKLADISQQSVDKVHFAMTSAAPTKELQWADLISLLQTIRNAL